ncbi:MULTISPECIES: diglucosylglycerate octanoyltransferase [Gordonia]|uniref:SGNH hydrolase-type esterase domain-containing protein n=2 Tax=Gordonia TaxID=2053 RepID=L7LKI6_9ACTN|nr:MULTISPECIES: diglucosylglycerate octanoyltransferase [Gordonia]AUH68472.1 SGNH/GDSL hydrolase family protein [Gordonia sp. YC-JH1]KJR05023.1 lysophospholipase [Gordonia sihwensis]KXT57537.1 lysophospholipase [Gordonia sp. QH-12]MBY4571058.1 SGNH/GDSL hydrolase family protein [Gordonia sihwensis]WFN91728.1 SGNH/GDSL hydrolase family protein [Gordonia sihwensis]
MGSIMVLGDSLSFYGATGGLAADDPRIWPNLVGADTGRDVELFARIGWTSRDIWWAITQDPRVWAAVPEAEVLVLAFGGMDSLPSPLPTALREQIRYVRPAKLRQAVRGAYGWLQPRLSPIGWPMAIPPAETARYFEKIRGALAHLRPDLPVVVALPPTHDSPYYGNVHPGRIPTTAAISEWARRHRLPTVDFYPVTAEAFADPAVEMNPDGIHWGFEAHRRIAALMTPAVRAVLG